NMWQKIRLYIISLFFLFILLFVNNVPYCFTEGCTFIGFNHLVTDYIILTYSIFFVILALIFYLHFDYKVVKGATTLPKTIKKIDNLNFETLSFFITYVIPLISFGKD